MPSPPSAPPSTPAPAPNKTAWKSFISGASAAVVGGTVTHPIDVVKVRQQLYGSKDGFGYGSSWVARFQTTSMPVIARNVVRDEGVAGLFKGASAGVLRQASFVGTKFLIYEQLKQLLQDDRGQLGFTTKIVCGLGSGFGGAVVGNPFDLSMVRMQADGKLPVELRRNYKSGIDAISRIIREEGFTTLWRGSEATVWRGSIITASQFAVYDQMKQELAKLPMLASGPSNHIAASFVASIVSGLASNPFDVCKSRLFHMQKRTKDGAYPYKGMWDCMFKTARAEGASSLFRGLGACIGRQIPLNAVRFVIMEQMTTLLRNH